MMRAAVFWMVCSLFKTELGTPLSRELQYSSLDVTKEFVRVFGSIDCKMVSNMTYFTPATPNEVEQMIYYLRIIQRNSPGQHNYKGE